MQRETHRYKIKRMSKLLFGDTPVWGVVDTHGVITVYTSYSQLLAEDECNRLNGVRTLAQCAS